MMERENLEEELSLAQFHVYSKRLPFQTKDFFDKYHVLSQDKLNHVLLESGRGGRYSIAGFNPIATLIGKDNELKINTTDGTFTKNGNPLHLVQEYLSQFQVEKIKDLPDFQGGAIGYISYDYARYIERLPNKALDDLGIPEVYFFVFQEVFVFDHLKEELWLLFHYEKGEDIEKKASQWEKNWLEDSEHQEFSYGLVDNTLKVSMEEYEFLKAVESVQQYISQGDVFQVNLSVRQSKPINVSAMEVYQQLRRLNPSPYMGYFHTPEFQLVSASPELLVKKNGDEVSTRPIAGTRSRGKDNEEDLKLANELIENEKERAEHVMLVDLERNDLGRVCEYGTVEVNEFMVIEKYSHVMHIVSNVRGKLAKEKTVTELIDAAFPGGTITGAPKVRTMEIIEELEPVRRGVYTGSLGWIGFNNDLELNIIIRTMLVKDGMAHVQAGAGIVIDSNPKHEYKESLKKAIALWKSKEMAEQKGEQE